MSIVGGAVGALLFLKYGMAAFWWLLLVLAIVIVGFLVWRWADNR